MKPSIREITEAESSYRIRWMSCFALAEAIVLAIFTLWPETEQPKVYQDIVYSDYNIVMEEVQITTQRSTPPPPPRPQVPIPVPNDEVIEEEILELDEIDLTQLDDPLPLEGIGNSGNSDRITANPQTPPSIRRIVEPTVPEKAKGIRAQIWVTFLINKEGDVEEAIISQIKIYDPDKDEYVEVNTIGYGLTEATIKAALQWRFRPASDNGSPVRSYTKHSFIYGD